MMKPVIRGKLTKRFFMSLKTGQYVVSNICNQMEKGRVEPCFREEVLPPESREEQWRRIESAHADGRFCDVLEGAEDYEAHIKSLPVPGQ